MAVADKPTYSTLAERLIALAMITPDTARAALEEMVHSGDGRCG